MAEQLGSDGNMLITAMEVWLAHFRCEVTAEIPIQGYTARGKGPRFVMVPLSILGNVRRQQPSTAFSPLLRWWGRTTSMLHLLRAKAHARGHAQWGNTISSIRAIINLAPVCPDELLEGSPTWEDRKGILMDLGTLSGIGIKELTIHADKLHQRIKSRAASAATAAYLVWTGSRTWPPRRTTAWALYKLTKQPSLAIASSILASWMPEASTAILFRSTVRATHLGLDPVADEAGPLCLPFHGFTPVVLHRANAKVLLVSIHLHPGPGHGGQERLHLVPACRHPVHLRHPLAGHRRLQQQPQRHRQVRLVHLCHGQCPIPG